MKDFSALSHGVYTNESKGDSHWILCVNPLSFHKMHYKTYGNKDHPLIIMVHGLTRSALDFEPLALHLAKDYYVVCPDMVGRGQSDWLPQGLLYTYPQYISDLNTLIARVAAPLSHHQDASRPIIWVGSSMGGLLGMILASLPNSPLTHLVLNDIGPFITTSSLLKLRKSLSVQPVFKTFDEAKLYVKQLYAGMGMLTESEWDFITRISIRIKEEGSFILHYDPRVAQYPVKSQAGEDETDQKRDDDKPQLTEEGVNFWPYWMAISCPVYVVRGKESGILSEKLFDEMQKSKPDLAYHVVDGAAHAPSLMDTFSMDNIKHWLKKQVNSF